jgi:hypothetical protein
MHTILKPTLLKIVLTLVLFLLAGYLWRMYVTSTVSDTFPWGFPLQFYLAWGPCPAGEVCSESNFLFLLLDLLFWYVVSVLLLSRFGRRLSERNVESEAK